MHVDRCAEQSCQRIECLSKLLCAITLQFTRHTGYVKNR